MKNLDLKKIIVIIIAFVLVIALLLLVLKSGNGGKKLTEEEQNITAENIKYFTRLKMGYSTSYNGLELLYNTDKVTKNDLSNSNILNTAAIYITNKEDNKIEDYVIKELKGKGYDTEKYVFYNGEKIREAIKTLFGIEWTNKSVVGETNFIFDFTYDEDYDIYLKSMNDYFLNIEANNDIAYEVIETKKENKDTLKVKIKVAYIYFNNENIIYYSDINNTEKIFENTNNKIKIDEEHLDAFETYTLTLKKVDDNYVFDSIEK